jgi:peptide/nickel transport system permease protein
MFRLPRRREGDPMGMMLFLGHRFVQSLVVILGVILVTFLLVHLLPGGPARASLGQKASAVQVEHFAHANGLDRPLPEQFLTYISNVARGNLGYSYVQNQTVSALIAENLPRDIVLLGISYLIALLIAIPLGIFQAIHRNGFFDYSSTGVAFLLYSMPSFFIGFLLIAAFSVQWQLLPSAAPSGSSVGAILGDPKALILPIATLALISIAAFSRYMRSSSLENLALDYIRTARAKGAPERIVIWRHLLRNSLLPVITLVGLSLPTVVAGAVVTEEVFNFPGMGLLFFKAAQVQDYPVLLGCTVFIGVATVIGNFLADVAYGLADPRIRIGTG